MTVVDSRAKVATAASTHQYPALLDAIQERHQQGPCLSAAWHGQTIRVDDLAAEQRWPLYRRDALSCTPIKSSLSFQLFSSTHTAGALNVYADKPNAFGDDAEHIGYVLATQAALVWDRARREEDFSVALDNRDVIGQAKGMIMARFNIGPVEAFELLKRISQNSNTKLVQVARQMISARDLP